MQSAVDHFRVKCSVRIWIDYKFLPIFVIIVFVGNRFNRRGKDVKG